MFFSFASQSGLVELDGESAQEFIAGLADNIGLVNIRAARIVAAAVAARTRSWLLQAWVGSSILYLGFFDDDVFSCICIKNTFSLPSAFASINNNICCLLERHGSINHLIFCCGQTYKSHGFIQNHHI